jgi:hypothetical protein
MNTQQDESLNCIFKAITDKEIKAQFARSMAEKANTLAQRNYFFDQADKIECELSIFRTGYQMHQRQTNGLEIARNWWIKKFKNFI